MDQRHFGSRSLAEATSSHDRAFITEYRSPRSRQPPSPFPCGAYANTIQVIIEKPRPIDAMSSYTTRAPEDLIAMNRGRAIALNKEAAPTNDEDIDGHKMMEQLERIYPTPVEFMKRADALHPSAPWKLLRKEILHRRVFRRRRLFMNSHVGKAAMRGFPRSKRSTRTRSQPLHQRLP